MVEVHIYYALCGVCRVIQGERTFLHGETGCSELVVTKEKAV